MRDLAAATANAPDAGRDRSVGAAPGQYEQFGAVRIVHLELGDVGGDPGDLLRTQASHQVMVFRVVGDVAA